MNITYNDIKDFLLDEELNEYIPTGVFYSKAIIGIFENKNTDCFFLYSFDNNSKIINPPFARIAIYSNDGSLAYYSKIDEKPFCSSIPKNYILNIKIDDNFKKNKNIYENRYCQIRDFSFSTNLSSAQKTILLDYKEAFVNIIDEEIQPFYFELSPEFWDWLNKAL